MVVMGTVGKAVVELDLDDKDFKNKTGQTTAGMESNFRGLQGTIMGVVSALGLVAIAKGAVDTLATLTKKAIEVADSFEVMEKQLTTLVKSRDKAQVFFAEIRDFAVNTPYQVRELTESFNQLYSKFGEDTIRVMKIIGDAAAGTGKSFGEVSDAFMMLASGNFEQRILRQLYITKDELKGVFGPNGELVVSNEEAMAQVQTLLESRFGGMMAGMMDTVTGKVSNLQDEFDALANAVGGELTPITKEFLEILIEAVKQITEAGELQGAVGELAGALEENKEEIYEIINLLPVMVDIFAELIRQGADLVSWLGELNELWKSWTGDTAIEWVKEKLEEVLKTLTLITEIQAMINEEGLRGLTPSKIGEAVERARTRYAGLGGKAPAETAMGPVNEVDAARSLLKAGIAHDAIDLQFRGFSAEAIAEATGGRGAPTAPRAPSKGKRARKFEIGPLPTPGFTEMYERAEARREADKESAEAAKKQHEESLIYSEEELKSAKKQLKEQGEFLMSYINPSAAIIAGLKSGEMEQAIKDFGIQLGTVVSEELLSKLIMSGLLAILNIISGGTAGAVMGPMPMARGGVLKAASGLIMDLPSRPGGWHIPFGGKMVNAAETGGAEVAAFLPHGLQGQRIILNQLAPMFNIPTLQANVETRPQNNITVKVEHGDRHHVRAYNESNAGKVNKAVTVRS